jgi:hypothetical protein
MRWVHAILSEILKKRLQRLESFLRHPQQVQHQWLMQLIHSAARTEWGKQYGYDSLRTYEHFKERIPLQDYETLKPYIFRIKRGETDILWPGKVLWFAKSSGTTNDKSKFIPVTAEALRECHYKGGKDLLAIYLHNNPDSKLFTGKLLSLGGSQNINEVDSSGSKSYYGDLSAILIQNLPFWIQRFIIPRPSIALMERWESKIELTARESIRQKVTNINGVPSWTLVLMNRILEITGRQHIHEVWPHLELFVHGAVNVEPYRPAFARFFPDPHMKYYETYNASEGFFGIQDRNHSDEMLLLLDHGVFYEFIPADKDGQYEGQAVPLWEVQTDVNYAMVITTNAGLWRYKIGDTIRFTSLNPYRIQVTGRTAQFINAFGEELMIDNAERAIAEACLKSGAVIREYTAAPLFFSHNGSGAHEWLIEFEQEPSSLEAFQHHLDQALKKLNSDYEAKRSDDMALQKPIIRSLQKGTFYQWLKSKNKLGGQHKVPRLANHRLFADEILNLIQSQ